SKVDRGACSTESPKNSSKCSHRSDHSEKGERPRRDGRMEEVPRRERQERREIHEGRSRHVDTWANLKREMITRFVSVSYTMDLYNRL
ncbi:hypothetical protein CR513_19257, partial [Mucuna pruriens]